MKKRKHSLEELRNLFAAAVAYRIRRVLDAMRIQGWRFPPSCDVGLQILEDQPLVTRVAIRVDDVIAEARVRAPRLRQDVFAAADDIVASWLNKHATARPVRRQRGPAHG